MEFANILSLKTGLLDIFAKKYKIKMLPFGKEIHMLGLSWGKKKPAAYEGVLYVTKILCISSSFLQGAKVHGTLWSIPLEVSQRSFTSAVIQTSMVTQLN